MASFMLLHQQAYYCSIQIPKKNSPTTSQNANHTQFTDSKWFRNKRKKSRGNKKDYLPI